jgi:hypothetical protein
MRRLLATVVAGVALAAPAAPSSAAAPSACNGVTVVVDFNALGGGEQTRCATGDPDSGVAALRSAGFTPTRAAQQPGYFVCRIDGKPANDPCQQTSPEGAYWSYWHAKAGGSWTYSSTGPADYDPAPGTVEGWAFGDGKPPSGRAPAKAAPSPSPARSPLVSLPSTLRSASPAAPSVSPSAAPSRSPRPSASPSASPSVSPSPSATASPSAQESEEPVAVDPVVPRQDEDGGSSGVGFLVAAVVVAALGAAGVRQARRRS